MLAESAPQSWPLSDPAHTAALQWISQQLGPIDPNTGKPSGLGDPDGSQAGATIDFINAADAVDSSLSNTPPQSPFALQALVDGFLGPLQDLATDDVTADVPFVMGLLNSALDMAMESVSK